MSTLSLNDIERLVGHAAALRCTSILQPTAGVGAPIQPPTFVPPKGASAAHKYTIFDRIVEKDGKVSAVQCCDLDTNQSQANRCEQVLQDLLDEGLVELPVMVMPIHSGGRDLSTTSYVLPHRNYDSHFYQGLIDGVNFKESEIGKALAFSNPKNAEMLFKHSPHTLIFGGWNSGKFKGGAFGTKIPRALVSEITAVNCLVEKKAATRVDPLVIKLGKKDSGNILYEADPKFGVMVTLDKSEAKMDKKNKAKEVNPSDAVLGSIPASAAAKGITMEYAIHRTLISLTRFRELKFPNHKADQTLARTYLTVLALVSVARQSVGLSLRSGCDLFPTEEPTWEAIEAPGKDPVRFKLSAEEALALLREVTEKVKTSSLPWDTTPVVVTPSKQHEKIIALSLEAYEQDDEAAEASDE